MLIDFTVGNFRSFAQRETLNMIAGADKNHPENIIANPGGLPDVLKSVVVYGANASGKSNLIKAISTMRRFILISATKLNQGDLIPDMVPFQLREATRGQPSYFDIKFLLAGKAYRYGFEADRNKVQSEWLFEIRNAGKEYPLLERHLGIATPATFKFSAQMTLDQNVADLVRHATRDNGLALATAAQLNLPLFSQVYSFFKNSLITSVDSIPKQAAETLRLIRENADYARNIEQLLRDADVGIRAISVTSAEATHSPLSSGWSMLPTEDGFFNEATIELAQKAIFGMVDVRTQHADADNGAPVEFDFFKQESDGTQAFLFLTGLLLDAISKSAVVVIDELGTGLHPLLRQRLLRLLHRKRETQTAAQLIFSTHDTTLLTPELLRRDQIWLAEKRPGGETELYSLFDFNDEQNRPRSTEAFARNYLVGRYGGIAQFGPSLA